MRPRILVCITLLAACHLQLGAQAPQVLINTAPAALVEASGGVSSVLPPAEDLPDDPGQELVPQAVPEQAPPSGTPVEWEA